MTYHDKLLAQAAARKSGRGRIVRHGLLMGIGDITLCPRARGIELKGLTHDVRMVGNDIRAAMKRVEAGE